ncbi:hypothetical protein C8A03DRAFT_42356 [Achaetomium macrosporum]|uniref:Uncharacterized protein n=1 Tax=Achaetomium macrosporum TaxID=79813 RepID=A0AAN7CE28_9PEZI|nr:hypothetical protein C8A03DRAFT_42356 [Achaetomium macrosporum]
MSSGTGQTVPTGLKPPYPPTTAPLGGVPTTAIDIPISGTLLGVFALAAAAHMFLFLRNNRRRHKFVFSVLLFGFCMTRIAALALRITWARDRANANLALAATVLTSAGVLILFIVNIILAIRVVRATHPLVGWARPVGWAFKVLIATVVAVLVMVVVCSVHQMFTLDLETRRMERDVMLFAGVYMTVVAVVPLVVMVLVKLLPRKGPYPAESFGKGSTGAKVALLAFTSTLLALGAGFRTAVNFEAKPVNDPQWYHSRAAFYGFNFAIEIVVVYTYLIVRFDQRFYVPDGSSKPGDYSKAGGSVPGWWAGSADSEVACTSYD